MAHTWDANGNLFNDGSAVYAYDFTNRLISTTLGGVTTQFGYNGDGIRLRLIEAGTLTTYTQDYAAPLPVVLQAKTGTASTQYVYSLGTRPLAEYEAAEWEYLLADPLGSVRQIADNSGNVTLLKSYEPYGSVLNSQGSATSIFGYSGEQIDSTGLIFLRARYMQPRLGIFMSPDPWSGNPSRPNTLHRFSYATDNPIVFVDHTGRHVDCNLWRTDIPFVDLVSLCKQANQPDDDPDTRSSVLDAREQIYYTLARLADIAGSDPNRPGDKEFARQMFHFLEGSGRREIFLSPVDPFINDPGITRATRRFSPPRIPEDEPDVVIPLLYSFIVGDVKRAATLSGRFSAGPKTLLGGPGRYLNWSPRGRGDEAVRAYGEGYWAAFGHVTINGEFMATGEFDCEKDGYIVGYQARYFINDVYEWFAGVETPVAPLAKNPANPPHVPHEWALSLVGDGRAQVFQFTVTWREADILFVTPDFARYRSAWSEDSWDYYQVPPPIHR